MVGNWSVLANSLVVVKGNGGYRDRRYIWVVPGWPNYWFLWNWNWLGLALALALAFGSWLWLWALALGLGSGLWLWPWAWALGSGPWVLPRWSRTSGKEGIRPPLQFQRGFSPNTRGVFPFLGAEVPLWGHISPGTKGLSLCALGNTRALLCRHEFGGSPIGALFSGIYSKQGV